MKTFLTFTPREIPLLIFHMSTFSELLRQWYRDAGRNLPWRDTNDPYPVWLSEIILQQTRVEQGMPYYLAFLQSFPTIGDLARADEHEVLKLWQGLGYYSRARNLMKTARIIADEYAGKWPSTQAELQKLPGVGPYTSAAIASFCFNEAVPVVDGNVYRVISRLQAVTEPIDQAEGKKKISKLAHVLLSAEHPAEHNQAMMDFGALICTPKKPKCEDCPAQTICESYRRGIAEELPIKQRKTQTIERYFPFLVFRDRGKILMYQRANRGIWSSLWSFPVLDLPANRLKKPAAVHREFEKLIGRPFKLKKRIPAGTHKLSHRELIIEFWEGKEAHSELMAQEASTTEINAVLLTPEQIEQLGVPKPVEKYLKSGI